MFQFHAYIDALTRKLQCINVITKTQTFRGNTEVILVVIKKLSFYVLLY